MIGLPRSEPSTSLPSIRERPHFSTSSVAFCTRQCAANSLRASASARLAPLLLDEEKADSIDACAPASAASGGKPSDSAASGDTLSKSCSSWSRVVAVGSSCHGGCS
eukprot:6087714-Prymnesium_polylepis.2